MSEAVTIEWRRIVRSDDKKRDYWRCLYAYVSRREREIVYLGKADRCTVRERWTAADKQNWGDWASEQEVEQVHLHVGTIDWGLGARYSAEKLADVESLLIKRLRPRGNIMSINDRICRPGVRVVCGGNWPHRRIAFVDT